MIKLLQPGFILYLKRKINNILQKYMYEFTLRQNLGKGKLRQQVLLITLFIVIVTKL